MQWQTNIYYGAGRVVVPALVDTFTIQAFAKRVGWLGSAAGVYRGPSMLRAYMLPCAVS